MIKTRINTRSEAEIKTRIEECDQDFQTYWDKVGNGMTDKAFYWSQALKWALQEPKTEKKTLEDEQHD